MIEVSVKYHVFETWFSRTPPDATMKPVDAPSAWFSPSDLDRKESDRWDSRQERSVGALNATGR